MKILFIWSFSYLLMFHSSRWKTCVYILSLWWNSIQGKGQKSSPCWKGILSGTFLGNSYCKSHAIMYKAVVTSIVRYKTDLWLIPYKPGYWVTHGVYSLNTYFCQPTTVFAFLRNNHGHFPDYFLYICVPNGTITPCFELLWLDLNFIFKVPMNWSATGQSKWCLLWGILVTLAHRISTLQCHFYEKENSSVVFRPGL